MIRFLLVSIPEEYTNGLIIGRSASLHLQVYQNGDENIIGLTAQNWSELIRLKTVSSWCDRVSRCNQYPIILSIYSLKSWIVHKQLMMGKNVKQMFGLRRVSLLFTWIICEEQLISKILVVIFSMKIYISLDRLFLMCYLVKLYYVLTFGDITFKTLRISMLCSAFSVVVGGGVAFFSK